jgi:hypothetical protein
MERMLAVREIQRFKKSLVARKMQQLANMQKKDINLV